MIDSQTLLALTDEAAATGEFGPLYDYCEEHGLDRAVADRLLDGSRYSVVLSVFTKREPTLDREMFPYWAKGFNACEELRCPSCKSLDTARFPPKPGEQERLECRACGGTFYREREPRCECNDDCPYNCKGQCGCAACREAYSDFLSAE